VQKIRDRAADLLRGKLDQWNRTLLADNGLALGREAAAASGKDCLPVKAFLDILDGRTTWRERETMERHVNTCWHCVDHNARMQEVIGLLRSCKPLDEAASARYLKVIGVEAERRPVWKRMFGAG
jgi:anti-sigma factor RsiW